MSNRKDWTEQDMASRYLFKLRRSGKVNMFEGPSKLQLFFPDMDRKKAIKTFNYWARHFESEATRLGIKI